MISRQNHINRISSSLVQLASLVDLHNKLDLFDINKHAEPFYRELLNRVYGWSLRSLNTSTNRNQPAIDLGDTSASISVQVTASDRRGKVQETLDKFHSHELYTEYKNLKIVVITNKSEFKKEFVTAKINFDKEHDILDISDLLWEMGSGGGLLLKTIRMPCAIRRSWRRITFKSSNCFESWRRPTFNGPNLLDVFLFSRS